MAFDHLRQRLHQQLSEMHNQKYIDGLVADAASLIGQEAPSDTGTLARVLTTQSPTVATVTGFHTGLGDRDLVGHETHQAPQGVIAEFLNDPGNEKYRTPIGQREYGDRAHAWQDLSQEAKRELQIGRLEGKYGGAEEGVGAGMAAYFFAQEGSLDGWKDVAASAGITPTGFVQKALDEWRAEALPQVMAGLRNKLESL